jgi:hypothetical protein
VPVAVAHFAGAETLWTVWMSAWLMTGRRVPARKPGELPRGLAVPS